MVSGVDPNVLVLRNAISAGLYVEQFLCTPLSVLKGQVWISF